MESFMLHLQIPEDEKFIFEEKVYLFNKYFPYNNIDKVFKRQNDHVKEREATLSKIKKDRKEKLVLSPLKRMSVMAKKPIDDNPRASKLFNFANNLAPKKNELLQKANSQTNLLNPSVMELSEEGKKITSNSFMAGMKYKIEDFNKDENTENYGFLRQNTKFIPKNHKRNAMNFSQVEDKDADINKVNKSRSRKYKANDKRNLGRNLRDDIRRFNENARLEQL